MGCSSSELTIDDLKNGYQEELKRIKQTEDEMKERKRKMEERQARKQLEFLSNHEKETKRFLKYIKSKMVPRLGRYTIEYITWYNEIIIGILEYNSFGLNGVFVEEKKFKLDHNMLKERMKKEFADYVTFRESSTNKYIIYYMIIKWSDK